MKHQHRFVQKRFLFQFAASLSTAFALLTTIRAQERSGIRSSSLNPEVNRNANVNRNVHANPSIGWNMLGNRTVSTEQHVDVEAHDGGYYPTGGDNENFWGGFAKQAAPAPDVGTVIHSTPLHARPVTINNVSYIFAEGNFYQQKGSDYVVVSPPIGFTISSLPKSAVETNINGQVYFHANDVYYRPAMLDGEAIYTVTKP